MHKKSYMAFARLLGALEGLRTGDGKFRRGIAPEVKNQVDTIEKCLYGLLDRIAYCQFDRHGKPMFLGAKAARAYREAVEAVRENEGEAGNDPAQWFNILSEMPGGTLDGVLHAEKGLE